MPPLPVGPVTATIVPLAYDTDAAGLGGPVDMIGPTVGNVSYSQTNASELHLDITVDFGQPNSRYDVFLTCGPAHATACGFANVGLLATDAVGAGSATITVGLGTLLTAPFGPGYRNDHLDMLDPAGSALTAGAINYFVCGREGVIAEERAERPEFATGEGDPVVASMSTVS